jgi:hypothetical protein
MVIFDDTLDPPKIAVTGFSPLFKTFSMASNSFAINKPKNLVSGKNLAIIAVEACSRCAVPKASFT